MSPIEDFFRAIDSSWGPRGDTTIHLKIIGSAALMLQADYERGTKDSDVLETGDVSPEVKRRLLDLAGHGTTLASRHSIYLEFVSSGLPFLPQQPLFQPLADLSASLNSFAVSVLDVVDVVVSKIMRFHAEDRTDIDAMIDKGLVQHDRLIDRFRSAVTAFEMDSRAQNLPKYVDNLHRVERDMLAVDESAIELPVWL